MARGSSGSSGSSSDTRDSTNRGAYTPLTMESDEESTGSTRLTENDHELVGGTAQQRNWRGIVIALLVILVVCALIITAVIIATPKEEPKYYGEKFTLDDFLDKNFRPKTFTATWLSGDRFLYRNADGALHIFNCSSNSSEMLLDNTTFRQLDTETYWLSADERYVLFKHDVQEVYRHSTIASYTVVVRSTKEEFKVRGENGKERLQYVAWSTAGNALVLVHDNNVYYKPSVNANPLKITFDGKPGEIYNGVPDWLYEEEILAMDHAVWFSPNGSRLCYAVFNDSQVRHFYFPKYGDMENSYTQKESIPYPKPGFTNPTVQLKVVGVRDMQTVELMELMPPSQFQGKEYYVTVVAWQSEDTVFVTWVNRPQNLSLVTLCRITDRTCQLSIEEKVHGGWVNLYKPPVFSPDGRYYFWVLPQRHANDGYYDNVARVQIKQGNALDIKSFLTLTTWDTTSIVAFDPLEDLVYFIGTGGDPRMRHLYSVHMVQKRMRCLTCELDDQCQYVSATFSPSSKFYILHCMGPSVPYYTLRSPFQDEELRRLENNTEFGERVAEKAMPRVEYIQVELDSKEKMWGMLLMPQVLNVEEIILYPLVVSVYGGPQSQTVTYKFFIQWETYVVSSRDVVVLRVDGRGSGGRGKHWMHQIYKRLGSLEVKDSVKATRDVSKYTYIDPDKIAIKGWSYGGYVTLSALGQTTDLYRCGISIAPVTDWIYYDSAYTERYMGFPNADDNLHGYKDANVSQYVENFKTSRLLLIHGTGDDNVHFQHSAQLMKAMVEADVYFRTVVYPDKHHGLLGGNTHRHLYDSMDDFLTECFDGVSEKFGRIPDPEDEKN